MPQTVLQLDFVMFGIITNKPRCITFIYHWERFCNIQNKNDHQIKTWWSFLFLISFLVYTLVILEVWRRLKV